MSADDFSISLRLLMKEMNILNVYQINIIQHVLYVQSQKQHNFQSIQPSIFINRSLYLTRFSDNNFKICDFNLKMTRFAIGFKGPTIRNKFPTETEMSYTSIALFKNKIK